METLIQDWRNRRNRPDMPFIQVLLAGYPEFSDLTVDKDIVAVSFANVECLHAKNGVIGGFEVAEEDKFIAAAAELDGETVKITIPGE